MKTNQNQYFIQPTNEGQDLNYIENYKGNLHQVIRYAKCKYIELKKILTQGDIGIKVLDKNYNVVYKV